VNISGSGWFCSPREEGTPVLEVQDLVPEDTRILKNRGWDFFPEK